jgi:replicative DNA helicase
MLRAALLMAKNILAHNADLPAVVFSLELDARPMFERGAAIAANVDAECVERIYRAGQVVDWRKSGRFRNLVVCTDSLTMSQIDEEITRASAKLGRPPKLVAIDDVQLVDAPASRSRYERVSDTCEQTRRLAKKHHADCHPRLAGESQARRSRRSA